MQRTCILELGGRICIHPKIPLPGQFQHICPKVAVFALAAFVEKHTEIIVYANNQFHRLIHSLSCDQIAGLDHGNRIVIGNHDMIGQNDIHELQRLGNSDGSLYILR